MSKPKIVSDQRGMVAIITTMILMIVISLIVLGFSQVVRRNQRQVLDTQLSSQAFYAAESGLNLARKQIETDSGYVKPECNDPDPKITTSDYDMGDGVEITCLLIRPVKDLVFTGVSSRSKASLIQPSTGTVGSIFINWEFADQRGVVSGCTGPVTSLPVSWSCSQPILRVDLIPLTADGTINRAAMLAGQFSAFLYPVAAGTNTMALSSGTGLNKGALTGVTCNGTLQTPPQNKTRTCMVEITGAGSTRYAIRMMGLYRTADVTVHVAGYPELVGAQKLVDSTGKAVDILKRVQARVPIGSNSDIPDFAIESEPGSEAACKRYRVVAGVMEDSDGCGL